MASDLMLVTHMRDGSLVLPPLGVLNVLQDLTIEAFQTGPLFGFQRTCGRDRRGHFVSVLADPSHFGAIGQWNMHDSPASRA